MPSPHGSIHAAFAAQAARAPGRIAIAGTGIGMSYGALDSLSDRIAARLRQAGLGAESVVAVEADRGVRLVAAWLGVLKAGCAYLPVDPAQPAHRTARMLADAGAVFLLGDAGTATRIQGIPRLDLANDFAAGEQGVQRNDVIEPGQLAYITYTSGSTGAPKGIAISHDAVLALVTAPDYVTIAAGDRIAFASHPAFDAATFEVWGALLHGATLVVVSRDEISDPARLAAVLAREQVRIAFLTTALFNQMVEHAPQALCRLDTLLFGGERADMRAVRRLLACGGPAHLVHVYGPTECTTFATWHRVASLPADAVTVPIGRPIQNMRAHVVDAQGNCVPPGMAGELWLGGPGLARGYVGLPALTAERFVFDDFLPWADGRLYRTGDQCVCREDGTIEYLGRIDRQVKIRGFRVEPGEIEAVLKRHANIRDAAVIAEGEGAAKRLVAYIVGRDLPDGGDAALVALARLHVAQHLPAYMHPAAFIVLSALPLTPSGKIDWSGLRKSLRARPSLPQTGMGSEVRRQLAAIYTELIGVAPVGNEEDFFALGGHSLLAARLTREIHETFRVDVSIADVFRQARLSDLATLIETRSLAGHVAIPAYPRGVVPLQAGGALPAFFCAAPAGGSPLCYRNLARSLGDDQPFHGLQSQGLGDRAMPLRTIEAIAATYVRAIRHIQPHGPYRLGGWSFGAAVAWEMACQLTEAGETVALLALIDGGVRAGPSHSWIGGRAALAVDVVRSLRQLGLPRRYDDLRMLAQWIGIGLPASPAGLRGASWRTRRHILAGIGVDARLAWRVFAANAKAGLAYRPGAYRGRCVLFHAGAELGRHGRNGIIEGLRTMPGADLECVPVAGDHMSLMLEDGPCQALAAALRDRLGNQCKRKGGLCPDPLGPEAPDPHFFASFGSWP